MGNGINTLLEVLKEYKEEKEAGMAKKRILKTIRETKNGKEKWCPKCESWYPADTEHFYKDNRSKLLLSSWCRKCQRKASLKNNQTKPLPGENKETMTPGSRLVLNFSESGPLFTALRKEAGQEFRTPEMQAMWLINKALFKEEASSDYYK